MRFGSCAHADEVRAMLRRGHWPNGCGAELRAHVEGCGKCAEQVLLTQRFQQARTEAVEEARVGSASLLWWRAQFRQRNAALEQVSKPLKLAQIFALVVGACGVVGFLTSRALGGADWSSSIYGAETMTMFRTEIFPFLASLQAGGSLTLALCGLATVALLGGVVVYLEFDN